MLWMTQYAFTFSKSYPINLLTFKKKFYEAPDMDENMLYIWILVKLLTTYLTKNFQIN